MTWRISFKWFGCSRCTKYSIGVILQGMTLYAVIGKICVRVGRE